MMRLFAFFFILGLAVPAIAQPEAGQWHGPEERWKTDILLVVAHPDDETAVGAYLARAVFDEGKSAAIVYCNKGTGGGNSRGVEQASAMGLIREIEARRATAFLGIDRVWFLNGRDTPGQDVMRSLQEWRHGALLEELVRIIRLTRPEVIFTWLPHFVAGENHGDHQAAGVIATEAFDLAGNPTAFPAQITPPREPLDIGNATEGLRPWQPKKLYFFSDASHPVEGDGPAFDLAAESPSKNVSYLELGLRLGLPHETQSDVSEVSEDALRQEDPRSVPGYQQRFRLLFGKSVMRCSPRGDVFEGIRSGPAAFVPPPGYQLPDEIPAPLTLGGPFAFYRDFWPAHGIERVADLVSPEIEVSAGSYLHIPLLLYNPSSDTATYNLKGRVPEGWSIAAGEGVVRVPPRELMPVQAFVDCPGEPTPAPSLLRWEVRKGKESLGSVRLNVSLVEWALPQ
ncbi:MAG: PIG-L family deacetylase [Bacteroidetes bacterium]|nr:PIG-L family deacetylase [Bacteroidota bacterium]